MLKLIEIKVFEIAPFISIINVQSYPQRIRLQLKRVIAKNERGYKLTEKNTDLFGIKLNFFTIRVCIDGTFFGISRF